jgi:hypothetical protein
MRWACAMWDGGGGKCAELCRLHSCSWLSSITARQLGAGARPLRHSSAKRDCWCGCDSSSWRGRGSSSWRAGVRARRRGGSLCCAGRRRSRRRCSRRGMMRCATRCGCSKARLAAGTAGLARLPRRERRARPRLIADDAVGRVGQARAHCVRSVEDDGEGGGGGGETRAASGRRRGRGSISGRLRGLAAPPRLSAPVRLIPEMVRRRAARHCRLCRAARTRAVRL